MTNPAINPNEHYNKYLDAARRFATDTLNFLSSDSIANKNSGATEQAISRKLAFYATQPTLGGDRIPRSDGYFYRLALTKEKIGESDYLFPYLMELFPRLTPQILSEYNQNYSYLAHKEPKIFMSRLPAEQRFEILGIVAKNISARPSHKYDFGEIQRLVRFYPEILDVHLSEKSGDTFGKFLCQQLGTFDLFKPALTEHKLSPESLLETSVQSGNLDFAREISARTASLFKAEKRINKHIEGIVALAVKYSDASEEIFKTFAEHTKYSTKLYPTRSTIAMNYISEAIKYTHRTNDTSALCGALIWTDELGIPVHPLFRDNLKRIIHLTNAARANPATPTVKDALTSEKVNAPACTR